MKNSFKSCRIRKVENHLPKSSMKLFTVFHLYSSRLCFLIFFFDVYILYEHILSSFVLNACSQVRSYLLPGYTSVDYMWPRLRRFLKLLGMISPYFFLVTHVPVMHC